MNLKYIQTGEKFIQYSPKRISEQTAHENIIQVQDLRGKVLYGTIEYPDTEENRVYLNNIYGGM